MLVANKISGSGFGKDAVFEVSLGGSAIGTINDTRSRFELDNREFVITRSGFLGPRYLLKCGDEVIVTASQQPFLNPYTLACGGKEWTFKAIDLLASKFGLFENEKQTGTVSAGPWVDRARDIVADLPEELPRPVQVFLLALFIGKLTEATL